jgi:sugar lactone lactonase YvrE
VTPTPLPPSNGLVWSADGQWLFWVTDTGTLRAWQRGQERPQDVAGAGHIPALHAIALAS